jgi:hypothetical protein
MTPVKIAICLLCLAFLFSESAFGICLGCILYQRFYRQSPHYCPGNVCQIKEKEEIQTISKAQLLIVSVVLFIVSTVTYTSMNQTAKPKTSMMKCQAGKCGG